MDVSLRREDVQLDCIPSDSCKPPMGISQLAKRVRQSHVARVRLVDQHFNAHIGAELHESFRHCSQFHVRFAVVQLSEQPVRVTIFVLCVEGGIVVDSPNLCLDAFDVLSLCLADNVVPEMPAYEMGDCIVMVSGCSSKHEWRGARTDTTSQHGRSRVTRC